MTPFQYREENEAEYERNQPENQPVEDSLEEWADMLDDDFGEADFDYDPGPDTMAYEANLAHTMWDES